MSRRRHVSNRQIERAQRVLEDASVEGADDLPFGVVTFLLSTAVEEVAKQPHVQRITLVKLIDTGETVDGDRLVCIRFDTECDCADPDCEHHRG